jgi:UDP-N-acetylglucosamine transferase subunit ALG13
MIFVTIGTQAPFDRLIRAIDELAVEIDEPIIAQINKEHYIPKHLKTIEFLSPDEFDKLLEEARLIIAHAGMGTIISALMKKKPIIVMPRLAYLREQRNDHQLATTMKMNELGYVHAAYDNTQLKALISNKDLASLHSLGEQASEQLVKSIAAFIREEN